MTEENVYLHKLPEDVTNSHVSLPHLHVKNLIAVLLN